MSDQLVRIEAPHFVAGLLMRGLTCVHAAPILKWAVNKDRDFLRSYFARKGWKANILQ